MNPQLFLWWIIGGGLAAAWTVHNFLATGLSPLLALASTALAGPAILTLLIVRDVGEPSQIFYRKFPPATALSDALLGWFKSKIHEGARLIVPLDTASKFSYHLLATILVLAPFVAFTAPFNPLTLLLLTTIVIPALTPQFSLLDKVKERKDRTDNELPFLAPLANVLTHAGMTLYDVFVSIASFPELFKQMSYEGKLLRRNVSLSLLGYGPIQALEKQAYDHPSENFRRLVLGTTSVWRSGGDVPTVLENRSEELMKEMEMKWESYADKTGTIGSMLLISFLLGGILIVGIGLAFPQLALNMLYTASGIGIPALTIISYGAIHNAVPKKQDTFKVPRRALATTIAASGIVGALLSLLGLPQALSVTISLLILSAVFNFLMSKQRSEVTSAEKAVQRFLRDITELRKNGVQLRDAIMRVAKQGGYDKVFDRFLRRVSGRMQLGHGIYDSGKTGRSWLTRMMFFLTKEIDVTGGGKPSLLEKVLEMLRVYELAWKKATSGIHLYLLFAWATPVALVASAAMIAGLWTGISPKLAGQTFAGISFATIDEVNTVAAQSMLLAVEATAAYCFLISKAMDGHIYGTWRVSVGIVVFLIMYTLYPFLTGHFSDFFIQGASEA